MKTIVLALLLLSGACTLRNANRTALAVSTVALAIDWKQTYTAGTGEGNWGTREEMNPVMGSHPSASVINAYFLSTIVINAAIWYVMPEKFKSVIPGIVTGAQIHAISNNRKLGL